MLRRASMLLLLAACGGEARRAAVTASAPALSAAPNAAATPHLVVCLDPVEGKPIDRAKLDEIERKTASPTEKSYLRARVYFDAERWPEAAKIYRALALEQPDSNVGPYAAQLYLECLNRLGTFAHRAVCFEDDMTRDAPRLREVYCGARRKQAEDVCTILDDLDVALVRVRAESLFRRAEDRHDRALYGQAAALWMGLFRTRCTPPTDTKTHCDEVAYNAAIAYLAAGDDGAAKGVLAQMKDPKNKLEASPLTTKLACRLDGGPPSVCR